MNNTQLNVDDLRIIEDILISYTEETDNEDNIIIIDKIINKIEKIIHKGV